MKIAILVKSLAYSFINQGEALLQGLRNQKVIANIIYGDYEKQTLTKLLRKVEKKTLIISVASWTDFDLYADLPQKLGFFTIPWFVDDEYTIRKDIVNKINRFGLLFTTSKHCKDNFIRNGVKENIIHILPEAIDLNIWKKTPYLEQKNILELFSSPNPFGEIKYNLLEAKEKEIPIIFTTGGHPTKKGAQEVMRALAKLDPKLNWIYFLKSWPFPGLMRVGAMELKLAMDLKIFHKVKYLMGEFSQKLLVNLINISDIYAAPSRLEGFGLPLVEAQACGVPVITSRGTATNEVVLHGKTGFKVKTNPNFTKTNRADIDDLAKYLDLLIKNKKLRQSIGAKAEQYVKNNFAPNIIAIKLIDLIVKLKLDKKT